MEIKKVNKIIDECGKLYEDLPDERYNAWDFLTEVNNIISKYKELDCLINFNFANGNIVQCICVITDWKPGAVVFQSDEGNIPAMRVVYPEEYVDFMSKVQHLFNSEYPEIPKEQLGE